MHKIPEEMMNKMDYRPVWVSKEMTVIVVFDDDDGSFGVIHRTKFGEDFYPYWNPFDAAEAAAWWSNGYVNVFDIRRAIFDDPVVSNDFRTERFVEVHRSITGGEA